MSSCFSRPLVLLAEDSEDDAFFFRWALQKCEVGCDLIHAGDGAAAIERLTMAGETNGAAPERFPDLLFLDLKMPAMNGFEVLEWIRQHPQLPPLEVAVLSGSDHGSDVERALSLGATAYFVKPISAEKLSQHLQAWLQRNGGVEAIVARRSRSLPSR